MSHAYIIEVQSRSAGIVVRDGRCYYFHAALADFSTLEGVPFKSPRHAEEAAVCLAAKRPTARASSPPRPAAG